MQILILLQDRQEFFYNQCTLTECRIRIYLLDCENVTEAGNLEDLIDDIIRVGYLH